MPILLHPDAIHFYCTKNRIYLDLVLEQKIKKVPALSLCLVFSMVNLPNKKTHNVAIGCKTTV